MKIRPLNEEAGREELEVEIKHGHFARAAHLAASLGLSEKEIRDLRCKALWQMSAVFRNAAGTKILAQQYGFSMKELKQILEQYTEERSREGNDKSLEPCYDHSTGKHLTFAEWMDHFLKN